MESSETRLADAPGETGNRPVASPWLGRVIDGRYRILEQLGEGGMGAVFIAEHLQLQKRVALKTIHAELLGQQEMAARFAREAMTSAHVEHPNVVSALDFGHLPEGGAFLVMQLARGPSLRAHINERGALPWTEACQIAVQIADAIAAAHASGIVHRDLKPENVVLVPGDGAQPTVKVLDFGIAHVKVQNTAPTVAGKPLTQVGMVMGTPGYMPPEQATGQAIDERADLYALGVMLWELLAGGRPFGGQTFMEIVQQQLRPEPPELTLTGVQEPPEALRLLVRALLQRERSARPGTASEVRDSLRALVARESLAAPQAFSAAPTVRHAPAVSAPAVSAPTWRYALASLALLAIVFVWWAFSGADSDTQPKLGAAQGAGRETAQERSRADDEDADAEDAPGAKSGSSARKGGSQGKSDAPRPVKRLKRALDGIFK